MDKTNCSLYGHIKHDSGGDPIKERFQNTLVFCPLYEAQGNGMNQIKPLCSECCIRTSMIKEELSMLLMKRIVDHDILDRPESVIEFISDKLKPYAKAMIEVSGKSFEDVMHFCGGCPKRIADAEEEEKAQGIRPSWVEKRPEHVR